jgi:hypothetical protein
MNNKLLYKHFGGNEYELVTIGTHSETLEQYVVYKATYGDQRTWIRPFNMFFGYVIDKYGNKINRFKNISKITRRGFRAENEFLNDNIYDGINPFSCPVDYKIDDCSSKEYGLTCETCFHCKDR